MANENVSKLFFDALKKSETKRPSFITSFLDTHEVDVNAKDPHSGETALHWASCNVNLDLKRKLHLFKLFIELGADLSVTNTEGKAALQLLVKNWAWDEEDDDKGIIEFLVEKGADPNGTDNDGRTALHEAALLDDSDYSLKSTMLLVKNRANLHIQDKSNHTPLYYAVEHGHEDVAGYLIKHGAKVEVPMLHAACEKGKLKVAELLITCQADVNARNSDGWTPLHFACYNGCLNIVKLLLNLEADIGAVTGNRQNGSPFVEPVASVLGSPLVSEQYQNDLDRKTPLELAQLGTGNEYKEIESILREHPLAESP